MRDNIFIIMHKLVEQNLLLFKTQKVENILAQKFRSFYMLFFFVGTNSSLSLREFHNILFILLNYIIN